MNSNHFYSLNIKLRLTILWFIAVIASAYSAIRINYYIFWPAFMFIMLPAGTVLFVNVYTRNDDWWNINKFDTFKTNDFIEYVNKHSDNCCKLWVENSPYLRFYCIVFINDEDYIIYMMPYSRFNELKCEELKNIDR